MFVYSDARDRRLIVGIMSEAQTARMRMTEIDAIVA